jgi:SAM-dependent methyltransferase
LATSTNKPIFTAPKKCYTLPRASFFTNYFAIKKTYTTTDLFSPLADVKADICNLPFEDNQYDVILCNHVLEHIPDDTKAMQNYIAF